MTTASLAEDRANVKSALSNQQIERRILTYRTAEVTLTVKEASGKPLANAPVTIRQLRHRFLFGCNAYRLERIREAELDAAYKKRFSALLNFATLPFYWGGYERRPGKTQQARVTAMARWCRDNNVRTKGHPLCWHEVVPRWLEGKPLAEVEKLQMGRITREVKGFTGLIDTWDVVNESVVMPRHKNAVGKLCTRIGRVELLKRTFATARKANPKATLVLNDFDTSRRCERVIRDCIKAGVDFDVIGIQSHMHKGYWGAKKAWEVCQRFAKFGKPLHFTELTILSGPLKRDNDWHRRRTDWHTTPDGEKRQAAQAAEFYRVLYSHPAVEAITWWDLSDYRAWQGAPAGLVRNDMSPKPAYEELAKRVKGAWWTRATVRTGADGTAAVRGFLGDYRASATAAGKEVSADVTLARGDANRWTLRLPA